jgi:F-type H+-transporting ATPase subunit delta
VISLTIARKYAKALLEIGRREKNNELLGKDLERLAELLQGNKELRGVLSSRFYPAPRRKAISQSIGESLALSKTTLDFLKLLIDRDRMDHFPAIVKSYKELYDEVSDFRDHAPDERRIFLGGKDDLLAGGGFQLVLNFPHERGG